jgi:hypothetical protein
VLGGAALVMVGAALTDQVGHDLRPAYEVV